VVQQSAKKLGVALDFGWRLTLGGAARFSAAMVRLAIDGFSR